MFYTCRNPIYIYNILLQSKRLTYFPPLILHWTIYIHVILRGRYIRYLIMGNSGIHAVYQTELSNRGTGKRVTKLHILWTFVASIAFNLAEQLGNLYVQSSLRPICLNEEYIESLWQHRDPEVHAVVIGNWSFIESVLKEVPLSLSFSLLKKILEFDVKQLSYIYKFLFYHSLTNLQATMFDRQPENIRRTALYAMSYWVVYTYRGEEANNNNTGDDVQFWSDVAMDNVLLIQVDSTHSHKCPPPPQVRDTDVYLYMHCIWRFIYMLMP